MSNNTPTPLTTTELQGMQKLIEQGRLNEFYTGLYDKGYSYAGWARGVANGDTLTGLAATDYLMGTALMGVGSEACKNLSAQTIRDIKQDMAKGYLDALIQKAEKASGALTTDVTFGETRDFHAKAFNENGLSIDNWTLETPMAILGSQFGEGFVEQMWGLLRETGGDGWDGAPASAVLLGAMWAAQQAAKQAGDTQTSQRIDDWLANTPGLHSADALRKAFDLLANFRDALWPAVERSILGKLLGWSNALTDAMPSPIIKGIQVQLAHASTIPSPIMLDLDGDGVETRGSDGGAYFDHAADGFAERTGWVGRDDGLLVRDLDGNGRIDTGRELFGSETLLASGRKAVNGFQALGELDSNGDGVVDASDEAYAQLSVWRDANGNGVTDGGELLSLEEAGVLSLNVGYTDSTHVDAQGNAHKQVGSYTTVDGQTRLATDVWFKTDATYSVPTEWVEVPEDIAALPDAQGYGKVRSLQQAMAMDASGKLAALVTEFTQVGTPEDRDALVTQIIYHWAGVQDVDPASRTSRYIYGNAIGDARKLEALEEFMGEEWVGVWCWGTRDPNPHGRAAPVLLKAWDELKALVHGQLLMQTHLKDVFQQVVYSWDLELEEVVGDLSAVASALSAQIEADRDVGLDMLSDFLYSLKGVGLLDKFEVAEFKAALQPLGMDVVQTMDAAMAGWRAANEPTEKDDVLRGTSVDDVIYGKGGNDRLLGREGNDVLDGGTGDDVLDGGAGNDALRGGVGSDTYRFGRGDGQDTVIEDSWMAGETDRIKLKAGVAPEDVTLARVLDDGRWWETDDLVLTIRSTGETLTVKKHFNESNRHAVEEIVFADGTVWSSEDIRNRVLTGGDGDDVLRGFADRDDTLDGGAGNDVMEGGSGADTYRFGLGGGHDQIIEAADVASQDVVVLGAGVLPQDVVVRWTAQGHLMLTLPDGSSLTVKDQAKPWAEGVGMGIEAVRFADGAVWDRAALAARAIAATDADDFIVGGYGDDVLEGGAGNDRFQDLGGYDTYVFGRGDGQDVINDTAGRMLFKPGIVPGDVSFAMDGAGLVATLDATGDSVRIENWSGTWQRMDRFDFANGTRLTAADVTALLGAGADVSILHGTAGNDSLTGGGRPDQMFGHAGNDVLAGGEGNDHLLGGDGDDLLEGGAGDDLLEGGSGSNVYVYNRGDGADRILVQGGADDTLRFGAGIRPEDLRLLHEEGASPRLVISLSDTESVTIEYAQVAGAMAPGGGTGALVPTSTGAVIDSGVIRMGVNPLGHLNVPYSPDPLGIGYMGMRYLPTGAASTEPGAVAEGWGVSNGVVAGYANAQYGIGGLSLISFEANSSSAVSRVGVQSVFEVTHAYKPSSSTNLYEVEVTIRNVSGQDQQAFYRRVMDWDIYPTPYNEYVTIVNSSPVVFRTDTNGFNSSNPLSYSSWVAGPSASNGYQNLIDAGPRDYGALFDFNFGQLAGEDDPSTVEDETVLRFSTYYGAAGSEAEAMNALARVGAEQVYSLGQPNTVGGAALGVPNTFVFAFKGVGGETMAPARLLDRFEFADGRVLSLAELLALPASTGSDGNDLLEARNNGEVLAGGVGSDVYRVHIDAASPGEVVIVETWRANDVNRIELVGDVDGEALWLESDGDDLLLRVSPGHSVRFTGFDPRAPGMQAPVSEIVFSGGVLTFEALLARGVRYGEQVQDTYAVNLGDGLVTIKDVAATDAGNVLRFGPGIDSEWLRQRLSFEPDGGGGYWLVVRYGEGDDVVRLSGFDASDPLGGGHAVDRFEFADGTVLTYGNLVAGGFVIDGDASSNELLGSGLGDRLYGHEGSDQLFGGAGSDELHGGAGNDVLSGGAGDDAYVFQLGNGVDTIVDSGESDFNFIRFGAGVHASDIRREWDGSTLILHYGDGDAVRIENYYSTTHGNPVIMAIAFDDGSILSLTEELNRAPVVAGRLADVSAEEGELYRFVIPDDVIVDMDASDELRFSARLATGGLLPEWLVFDAATRTLSGTPTAGDAGVYEIAVTATDLFGANVTDQFTVTVKTPPAKEGLVLIGDWQANTLTGGAGNDIAYGNGGADYINLFGGDNLAYGSYGNDVILTGDGDDTIYGGGGNDFIDAGGGRNKVYADWGDDVIRTGDGDDLIEAGGGGNQISSGAGRDKIVTLWGDDTIDAGAGDNDISAGEGKNHVTAGSSNDVILTGSGDDTIHAGNGDNIIMAGEGRNRLYTGSGQDRIEAFGSNVIEAGAGDDAITTGWGADIIDAGDGNDVIRAGGGGDTVRGGGGNDLILATQWSDDRYFFARGDGQDTLSDQGGADVLHYESVHSEQLWFQRNGADLQISIIGTDDQVTVSNWYSGSQYHIEQIKTSDGKTLLDSQVDQLVQAMAGFAPPSAGETTLPQSYQATLVPVLAASWS